ncbi:MAG TPA: hypothetical protein VFT98_08365 [Myxococcota bacterium]|nr:hypothetical protein [Myxococcota bacterium]
MKGKFARCAALAGVLLCVAVAAEAQAPHLIPPLARGLHERIAGADVIAIATVVRIEPGRIALRSETALRGAPPAELAVKRSPLRPPPLAEADRALFILRGDRPPYVLVDEPDEIVRFADAREAEALARALPELLGAGGDAARISRVYDGWRRSPSDLLRALARDGALSLQASAAAAASQGTAAAPT